MSRIGFMEGCRPKDQAEKRHFFELKEILNRCQETNRGDVSENIA